MKFYRMVYGREIEVRETMLKMFVDCTISLKRVCKLFLILYTDIQSYIILNNILVKVLTFHLFKRYSLQICLNHKSKTSYI